MKRITNSLVLISLLLPFGFITPKDNYLKEIRKRYTQSVESSKIAETLIRDLSTRTDRAVLMGYKGATEAVMAKHAFLPNTKLKYLKQGMATLKQAISKDVNNIEIRFLRFAIEDNLPNYLGYSTDLIEDKNVIVKNLPNASQYAIESDYKAEIIQYMLKSDECTSEDKKKLKAMIN